MPKIIGRPTNQKPERRFRAEFNFRADVDEAAAGELIAEILRAAGVDSPNLGVWEVAG